SLRVGSLGSNPIKHLLRTHIQPLHIDVGMGGLEASLDVAQQVRTVGRVDDQLLTSIIGGTRCDEPGGQEQQERRGAAEDGVAHPSRVASMPAEQRTDQRCLPSESRFTSNRWAPGTPWGI